MATASPTHAIPDAHERTAHRISEELTSGAVVVGCDIQKGMGRVPLASAILARGNATPAIYIVPSPGHAAQAGRGLAPHRGVEAMTIRQAWDRAKSNGKEPSVVFVDEIQPEDRDLLGAIARRWENARIVRFETPAPSAEWLVDGGFPARTLVRRVREV